MKRDELVAYLDEYLGTRTIQDSSDNGLQVEGVDAVARLAFAVDACQETIDRAIADGAQMLIVHHGLFWGKALRIVGPHRRRVQSLLGAGCSLYATHLPLDGHPQVGNNAQMASLLGLQVIGRLGEVHGAAVGVIATAGAGIPLQELIDRLTGVLGQRPLVLAEGSQMVRQVGIISGGAAGYMGQAVAAGCDTYITGETSHTSHHDAEEYGVNAIYAGHYATEVVGLKALADHLVGQFGISTVFLDSPTGM